MQATPAPQTAGIEAIHRGRILGIRQQDGGAAECALSQGAPFLVPGFSGPIPRCRGRDRAPARLRTGGDSRSQEFGFSPVARALPGVDWLCDATERGQAEGIVCRGGHGREGIRAVHLPCHVLRDYFYAADRHREWSKQPTYWGCLQLRVPRSCVSPSRFGSWSFIRRLQTRAPKRRSNAPTTFLSILN